MVAKNWRYVFFHGTMYIYEKVGNSKPDWFIYDKVK